MTISFPQTISEALSLGIVVTYFDVDLVLKSLLITTAVFLALTAYTMQSRYDFSTWGARQVIFECVMLLSIVFVSCSLFSFLWILIIGGVIQVKDSHTVS